MSSAIMMHAVLLLLSTLGTTGEMTALVSIAPASPAQASLLLQWAVLVAFFFETLARDFFLLYSSSGNSGVSREHYGASHWMSFTALMLSTECGFFYNYATARQQRRVGWLLAAFNAAVLVVVLRHSWLLSSRRVRHMIAVPSTLVVLSTYAVGNTRWPHRGMLPGSEPGAGRPKATAKRVVRGESEDESTVR